jgi:Ca-activated chloride channel family protein
MSALPDFHFVRPAWLLLLAALPALWWLWRRDGDASGGWSGAVDSHLLPHLIERGDARTGAGIWLAAAIWLVLVFALAGPAWDREPVPLYHNDAARVLALELAPSMLAQDVRPSRVQRAHFKLNDILSRSSGMQTALIAYAGDAFVAAPLTDDANTVRNLVDSLAPDTMPVPGNATARAITRAVELVRQAGLDGGELVILADSAGPDAVVAARKAHAQGLAISVLGVGDTGGAPIPLPGGGFLKDADGNIVVPRLDEAALRDIAAAGGGRYARLTADATDLDSLLVDRGTIGAADAARADTAGGTRWRDRGPWFVLLAVPLALAAFRRGWLMVLALVLLAPVPEARAFGFADLWRRPDQQAAAALAADDAKKAGEVARSPGWRGAAAYRGGDYEQAAAAYAQASGDAQAAYNRGNALARLGRYDEALDAWDEALKLEPGMADALANKQAVEEWLKNNPPPPQQNQPQDSTAPGADEKASGQPDSPEAGAEDSAEEHGKPKDGAKSADSEESAAQESAEAGQSGQSEAGAGDAQTKPTGAEKPRSRPQGGDASAPSTNEDAARATADTPAGPDADQQDALRKSVDAALAKPGTQDATGKPARVRGAGDTASKERQQALEQWLERVPDDPGGLLRRKFLLEYQQRQRDGGEGR